jgi:hypothetical protein
METSRGHSDFRRVGTQLPLRFGGSEAIAIVGVVLNKTCAADILIRRIPELVSILTVKYHKSPKL